MTEAAFEAFMEIAQGRRSVRRYRDAPVPQDDLERAVAAASWAPSAGNRQDWLFRIVRSDALKRDMAQAARDAWERGLARHEGSGAAQEVARYVASSDWLDDAPVVIAVLTRRPGALQVALLGASAEAASGGLVSAAMAAQNLMLALHALGLATCCMTAPLAAAEEIELLLGHGRRHRLVCLIAAGYPAELPTPPSRKPVAEIVRFDP